MRLGKLRDGRAWGLLAVTAGLGALLLGAAPARAGGGFHNGFENELGRIAAREVVRVGKIVLLGGRGPYFAAQWAAAYPAPGYEEYGAYYPPPPRRPVRYRAPAYAPPAYPSAAPVYAPPAYPAAAPAYPPSAAAPCEQSAAAPYEEHIVWERYERIIQHPAPPSPSYDPYEQQARY